MAPDVVDQMAQEIESVASQFEDRAETLLVTYPIAWPGKPFKSEGVDAWYEVNNLGFVPTPANGSTRIEDWIFQIDCVALVGRNKSSKTVLKLVDEIRASFERVKITVYEGADSGNAQLGELQFLYIQVDETADNSATRDAMRYAVTIPAKFLA